LRAVSASVAWRLSCRTPSGVTSCSTACRTRQRAIRRPSSTSAPGGFGAGSTQWMLCRERTANFASSRLAMARFPI
jgi:hypothetical protein